MSSLYIWIALLSAAIFGLVTVLDKRLIAHNLPNLSCFYVAVAISLLSYATATLLIIGIPENVPVGRLLVAVVSGICWGGALGMMFWGYKYEEASRASAIIHTFPVFVAMLAVIFLGEVLGVGQWIAIFVVVAAAFMISLRGLEGGRMVRLNRAFPILIGASLFTALALITGKYALEELPVGLVYSLRNYGMGVVFLLLWRPGAFRQLLQSVRSRETLVILFLAEFSLAPLATLLNVAAVSLGPVSLVSTLTGTRPFFVFIYGTLLSVPAVHLLEEPLERNTLTVKLVAIAMVVGGIAMLNLL